MYFKKLFDLANFMLNLLLVGLIGGDGLAVAGEKTHNVSFVRDISSIETSLP